MINLESDAHLAIDRQHGVRIRRRRGGRANTTQVCITCVCETYT
jgi:hypothetical protein